MANFTIYKIHLLNGAAIIFKELSDTNHYTAQKETSKYNRLCRSHQFEYAYVYKEVLPGPKPSTLEIPVL